MPTWMLYVITRIVLVARASGDRSHNHSKHTQTAIAKSVFFVCPTVSDTNLLKEVLGGGKSDLDEDASSIKDRHQREPKQDETDGVRE